MFYGALRALFMFVLAAVLALPATASETTESGWTAVPSAELPSSAVAGWYTTELGRSEQDRHWAAIWIDNEGEIIRELVDYCVLPGPHFPLRGKSYRVGEFWTGAGDMSGFFYQLGCPMHKAPGREWKPVSWKEATMKTPPLPDIVTAILQGATVAIDGTTVRAGGLIYDPN